MNEINGEDLYFKLLENESGFEMNTDRDGKFMVKMKFTYQNFLGNKVTKAINMLIDPAMLPWTQSEQDIHEMSVMLLPSDPPKGMTTTISDYLKDLAEAKRESLERLKLQETKRKRGRPKGSKNKVSKVNTSIEDEIFNQEVSR